MLGVHSGGGGREANRRLRRSLGGRGRAKGDRTRPHRRGGRALADRAAHFGIERPRHLNRPTRHVADRLRQRRNEVVTDPLEHELVARRQRKDAVRQVVELDARKPLVERCGRASSRVMDGLFPKLPGCEGRGGGRGGGGSIYQLVVTRHRHTIHTLSTWLWKKAEPQS